MKFVCPKMKWKYNKEDRSKRRVCYCENPCTTSSCGRMIYGLDRSGVLEIRELLKQLMQKGRMILLASHNSEDIEELCNVVFEMDGGEIINTIVKEE